MAWEAPAQGEGLPVTPLSLLQGSPHLLASLCDRDEAGHHPVTCCLWSAFCFGRRVTGLCKSQPTAESLAYSRWDGSHLLLVGNGMLKYELVESLQHFIV